MSKVFWGEGLFLRPQHFQRQDAYHEARVHEMGLALHPYPWGVRDVRFDLQSIASGTFRVLQLSLVFPDGEIHRAPGAQPLPEPVSLASLPTGVQSTTLFAALPLLREHGGNCVEPGSALAVRYAQANHSTADLYTDACEAELAYLSHRVRILTEDEPRDAFSVVPIARVRRTATGGFELDEEFVPPALHIGASPALLLGLRRLLDALQAKVDALYGHHRAPSQSVIEFRSGDMASFWLLHTVNGACAALSHCFRHPGLHPERLYQELLRLAGELLTFSASYALANLPAYDHARPESAFTPLLAIIRELIDTVISARYFQIALNEVKPSFHLGRLDSQRIDEGCAFYLGVAANLPGPELTQSVPIRFKVGAPDDVDSCVLSALPGVKLVHAAQVPAAIPVRPGLHYFALEPRGALYERMLKAQSVTIYVPAGLHDLKLELIAVAP
ncbi:type VI secretion system baseplate subunit TssK [Lysobacter olei]